MGFIRGRIDRVLHQSGTYNVLAVRVEDTDFVVRDANAKVSGHLCGLPKLAFGVTLQFVGQWVNHPKYGRQFAPNGWFPWAPSTRDVARFLYACMDGFEDLTLVERLVAAFGLDTFQMLTEQPAKVLELIPSSDPHFSALDSAILKWKSARTLSNLSIFLQDYDMGPETVSGVFGKFGHDAIEILSKNPYRLIAVEGFSFAKADSLATRMGIGRDDPRRMDGAVLWVLRTEARQGHLFVRRGDMPALLSSLSSAERTDPFDSRELYGSLMEAVARLEAQLAIKVDPSTGVYLPELLLYEREAAAKLARFIVPSEIEIDTDLFLSDYETSNQIELSEAQRDAVRKLVKSRVLVLTGLPGTGKTTVVRTFVRLFKHAGVSFTLMAPTGIAAKRLASVTSEEAGTIHRTLGYNGSSWGFSGEMKLPIGAVIIDEMSMVDMELLYRILDALHPSTMLVFVGDDAQLPSVGPGNVLRELLMCSAVPNVRLTQIFRQDETSDIVIASHKINKGSTPLPDARDPESEFQFVSMQEEEKIVELVVAMALKLKGRNANFQVLAPKYEGLIGVNNLNARLRDCLNPSGPQKEVNLGLLHVREGDRLMVVQNNYTLNVYNGDMGKLHSVEKDHLVVRIHGIGPGAPDAHVRIPKELAPSMLKLAYAITVHKCQGSEFDTVIFPILRTQGRMLQRNLFYTAVTRARKKVWLLGDSFAVLKAIANDRVVQRNTVFGRAIMESVALLATGVGGSPEDAGGRRETEPTRPIDTGAA